MCTFGDNRNEMPDGRTEVAASDAIRSISFKCGVSLTGSLPLPASAARRHRLHFRESVRLLHYRCGDFTDGYPMCRGFRHLSLAQGGDDASETRHPRPVHVVHPALPRSPIENGEVERKCPTQKRGERCNP